MNSRFTKAGWGTGTIASLGRSLKERNSRPSAWRNVVPSLVNLIDTADSYGSGDAERMIRRLLQPSSVPVEIITKAGYVYSNLPKLLGPANQFHKKLLQKFTKRQCFDVDYLKRCAFRSLDRLGVNKISGFLLHDPPLEVIRDNNVWALLDNLKTSGIIQRMGVSSSKQEVLAEAICSRNLDIIETPAYLKKAIELQEVWRMCQNAEIHIIANHIFYPRYLVDYGLSHQTLASAAAAMLPANSSILCGTRSPIHLAEFAQWVQNPLSEIELKALYHKVGLEKININD